MSDSPLSPASRFHWNAGGWFGAQFGGTLWLLVLSGVALAIDGASAAVAAGGFLVANAWGCWLWSARGRLRAFPAMLRFLGGLAVVFAAVVATGRSRMPELLLPYWVIGAPLVLIVWFVWLEGRGRGRAGNAGNA